MLVTNANGEIVNVSTGNAVLGAESGHISADGSTITASVGTLAIDSDGNTVEDSSLLITPTDIIIEENFTPSPSEDNLFYQPVNSLNVDSSYSTAESAPSSLGASSAGVSTSVNIISSLYNNKTGEVFVVFDKEVSQAVLNLSLDLKVGTQRFSLGNQYSSVMDIGNKKHILKISLSNVDKDTVNYLVDQEMPTIFLSTPYKQERVSGDVPLKFTIYNTDLGNESGKKGIKLTIDSDPSYIIYTKETTLSGLSTGEHTIRAQLIDYDSTLNTNIEAICESTFVVYSASYTLPYLSVQVPKSNEVYASNVVQIEFLSENFPVIPSGQHIQYTLDTDPPIDHYVTDPIVLTDLENGEHIASLVLVDENGDDLGYNYGTVNINFIVGLNSNAIVQLYASGVYLETGNSITNVDVANVKYMKMYSPLDIQFIDSNIGISSDPSIVIAKLKHNYKTPIDYQTLIATDPYIESSVVELDMDGNAIMVDSSADFARYKDEAQHMLGSVEKIGRNNLLIGDSINKRAIIVDKQTNQIIWQYDSDRNVVDFHLVNEPEITISMTDGAISLPLLYIRKGTTVIWENNSTAPISIYSGTTTYESFTENPNLNLYGDEFSSGVLQPGESYSFKFINDAQYSWFVYPSIITGYIQTTQQRLSSEDQYLILESDGLDSPFSSRLIKVDSWGNTLWSFGEGYLVKPRDARPMLNNKVLIST